LSVRADLSKLDALVIGNGFLANYLVPLLAYGRTLLVSRTGRPRGQNQHSAHAHRCLAIDITKQKDTDRLAHELVGFCGDVFFLLPPSTLADRAPASALGPLFGTLQQVNVRRVIVTSSTGVYRENTDAPVSAASGHLADTPRARRLLGIEQAWLASGFAVHIARLAGLYGRGRIVGRGHIERGDTIAARADGFLNLVHGADAARAVLATAELAAPPLLSLISDGEPVRRRDYYYHLAQLLGAQTPRFSRAQDAAPRSRRCDPNASWQALGLTPNYASYQAGLGELVAEL
jgi:nucleoside-diphosphate-sugar epimerase